MYSSFVLEALALGEYLPLRVKYHLSSKLLPMRYNIMVMRKSPHCYKKAHAEETIRSKKSRHVMDVGA